MMTALSDTNASPEELRKRGGFGFWGLLGFLLSLPTLAGWVLSLIFWIGSVQSVLLAAGSVLGAAGFLICLNVCIRRHGRRRLAVCGLVLGVVSLVDLCALAAVVACDLLGKSKQPDVEVAISKETTYITGPLRPDGYPDYLAALNERYGKGVTPDNNAAVLVWRAVGPKKVEERLRPEFFRRLGMEPLPADGEYFLDSYDYTEELLQKESPAKLATLFAKARQQKGLRERLSTQFRNTGIAPWPAASRPAAAEWLQRNERPLALFVAASKRPRFFSPLVSDQEPAVSFGETHGCLYFWSAADALCSRAMLRWNDGRVAEAREDILACRRLARLAAQQLPSSAALLNACFVEKRAHKALLALFHYGAMSVEAAKALDRQIQQFPDLPDPLETEDFETRCTCLDCMGMIIRGGQRAKGPLDRLVSQAVVDPVLTDWDGALRYGNAWHDRSLTAARIADWTERMRLAGEMDKECQVMGERTRDVKWLPWRFLFSPRGAWGRVWVGRVLSLTSYSVSNTLRMRDEMLTRGQLLRLASLIHVYRAEHGGYPATLKDLTPKYLATLPVDLYHGKAFRYRIEGAGYVLYSVGPDGVDDLGNEWTPYGPGAGCDDIAVTVPPKAEP
jgi:hypothetical protein